MTRVRRIGTVGGPSYPPVRGHYTLPGTTNGGLRAIASRLPRLPLPVAGGLGGYTWRAWLYRPSSDAGTLIDIVAGDASISVSIESEGTATVEADDGADVVSSTSAMPLPELSWVAVAMVVNGADDSVVLYVGDEVFASLDASTLNFPDEYGASTSYTIGTAADGTDPLGVQIKGIGNWDVALTPEEVAALASKGPDFDVRNLSPEIPSPVEYWIEPIDAVVPGLAEPLIPMSEDVESEVEPSEFHWWPMGDHRIGVYSSAWWGGSALDPAAWSLAFDAPEHADVFGEPPRVVVVNVRADGAIMLDLDARMVPGVSYGFNGPADLAGNWPPLWGLEE